MGTRKMLDEWRISNLVPTYENKVIFKIIQTIVKLNLRSILRYFGRELLGKDYENMFLKKSIWFYVWEVDRVSYLFVTKIDWMMWGE